jgi:tryptophan 2,3-dioxygenase
MKPENGPPEFTNELSYGSYLMIPELLALQSPKSRPEHHDELQFIIVHQVYELWFKLVLHEVDHAAAKMVAGEDADLREAIHALKRVHAIQHVLLEQIHVLESMRPQDFLAFRGPLKPASGFQSAQFRELEFALGMKDWKLYELCTAAPEQRAKLKARFDAPDLVEILLALLRRRGLRLASDEVLRRCDDDARASLREIARVYADYAQQPVLYELLEGLVLMDELLLLWRRHHVMMVERHIGSRPGTGAPVNQGLDGSRYLISTLGKRAFPFLWQARNELAETS